LSSFSYSSSSSSSLNDSLSLSSWTAIAFIRNHIKGKVIRNCIS
jgi:hypothetical protein